MQPALSAYTWTAVHPGLYRCDALGCRVERVAGEWWAYWRDGWGRSRGPFRTLGGAEQWAEEALATMRRTPWQ